MGGWVGGWVGRTSRIRTRRPLTSTRSWVVICSIHSAIILASSLLLLGGGGGGGGDGVEEEEEEEEGSSSSVSCSCKGCCCWRIRTISRFSKETLSPSFNSFS